MKSQFESFGAYLSESVVSTESIVNKLDSDVRIDIERITGIKTRRKRSPEENSLSIGLNAARECLNNSKYDPEDLDVIINTSITRFKEDLQFSGDPPLSLWIKEELGAEGALNFDITNACAGMMTGAWILDNMIKAGIIENGMVISGECITPISDTAEKEISNQIDSQFASLTVGDAGGAFIMDESEDEDVGIEIIEMKTFAKHAELCFGMPSVENPGPAMYTKAVDIHSAAFSNLPIYVNKVVEREKKLRNKKWGIEEIDFAIPHQTSVKSIEEGLDKIKNMTDTPSDEFPEVIVCVDKYGNTASTSNIVALYRELKEGRIKEGQRIAFLVLASGLVLGFIVFTVGELKMGGENGNEN